MTKGYEPYPRRRERTRPDAGMVAFVACLFGLLLSVALLALVRGREAAEALPDEAPAPKVTHDSLAPTYTYDGEVIRWYVFTDPDSGVQYLVNDRGGTTPRLDGDGRMMGVSHED